jgi:hypothetical protein
MRKLWFAIAICGLFCCMPLFAAEYPTAEIYGGYQLSVPNLGENMHGLFAGGEYNFSPYSGLAGEFGYGQKTINNIGYSILNKNYSFLAGPRFSYRAGKARAFAHVLVGGVKTNSKLISASMGLITSKATDLNFQTAFGGGLEVRVNDRLSVRPAQLELVQTLTTNRQIPSLGAAWDSGLRFSAGLVFKFGSKGK